jgi:hypothetical protein
LLAENSLSVVGLGLSEEKTDIAPDVSYLFECFFPLRMLVRNQKREPRIVIHYSCDRCKREIDTSTDLRYTVTIEIEAALDGPEHELVDDPDHLDEIQDMLDSADDLCSSVFDDDVYQRKQFDLCKDCFRNYIKNPLSRESTTPLGFSKN